MLPSHPLVVVIITHTLRATAATTLTVFSRTKRNGTQKYPVTNYG